MTFPDIPECITEGGDMEEAIALNINFSQVLQDALMEKVNAR